MLIITIDFWFSVIVEGSGEQPSGIYVVNEQACGG